MEDFGPVFKILIADCLRGEFLVLDIQDLSTV